MVLVLVLQLLTIKVVPAKCFAPCTTELRITGNRHPDNRLLTITIDGENFYRSGEIPLEGEHSPATFTFPFRNVPPGLYEITVILKRNTGEVKRTHTTLEVIDNNLKYKGKK